MFKKQFNYATLFCIGLFFCLLGIGFIVDVLTTWNWIYFIFIIGIALVSILKISNLVMNYKYHHDKLYQLLDIFFWSIILLCSLVKPHAFYYVIPKIIGAWIFIHALVKIFVIYIRIKDHLKLSVVKILFLFVDLCMSSFLLLNPYQHHKVIGLVIGLYFLIYGINGLWDFIREIMPKGVGSKLDKKLQLALPPFVSAIIPPHILRTLLNKDDATIAEEEFNEIKENIPIDMEVLIHLAPSGPAMFGHTDIIYKNHVISYGCYDPHKRTLFGTYGDGVVLVANKNTYIHNCLENENKILISFEISLTKDQKQMVNKKLLSIKRNCVRFYSDEELSRKGLPCMGICDDYISRVTRTSPDSKFYKIRKGELKTFFVLSTNCVCFMSNILNSLGLNLFDLSGIISPGAYYDFMNRQFKSDKSFVISRKLYTKKDASLFEH